MLNKLIHRGKVIDADDWKSLIPFYSPPYIKQIMQERVYTGKISVTTCQRCPRMYIFKQLLPFALSVDDQAFAFLGTRTHKHLEDIANEQKLGMNEEHLEMSLDDNISLSITGISDMIFKHDGDYILADHKTWGSYRVALALGLEKKKRPMVDNLGNPILYKRNGKDHKKGEPRQETYFVENPDKVDLNDVIYQLNMYRIIAERKKIVDDNIKMLRVYVIVRDGGLMVATSRGIFYKNYAFDVPIVEDNKIIQFHKEKAEYLTSYLDHHYFDSMKELVKDPPRQGTEAETLNGFLCEKACPVSAYCRLCKDHPKKAEVENDISLVVNKEYIN